MNKIEKIICFVHIPRCGGTTIHSILSNNLRYYVLLNHKYSNAKKEIPAKNIKMLKWFIPFINGIGGHPTRTFLNYEKVFKKPLFYFTFVRNPIDRYMSHLNFARFKGIDVADYINQELFDNVLTLRFAGNYDVKKAKRVAKNDYDFIGLQEKFDESLILLKERLDYKNFNIHYEKKNELKNIVINPLKFSDLSDNNKKIILHKIRYDRELFQYIVDEVFNKYIHLYRGKLEDDVRVFTHDNNNYKFPEKDKINRIFFNYQNRIQKIVYYYNS